MSAPFLPAVGKTQKIAATTASSSITLDSQGAASSVVRLTNTGTTVAFVRFSLGANVASAAVDVPVLPGTAEAFSKGIADTVSAITESGTTSIYVTPGEGE